MPNQYPIIDRKIELDAFVSLLTCSSIQETSILLLEDSSGRGKTKLLSLYDTCCQENKIPVSRVDLKGGSLNPIDILKTIRRDFHPLILPTCNEVIKRPFVTPPSVEISNNTGLGQTHYSLQTNIQLANYSREEQEQWWETGAQALLDDLLNLAKGRESRFVILFDTYEKASAETQAWLSDHILRMATPQRMGCLIIVIAGKTIPTPTSEWEQCCRTINLSPLQLQDWQEYAGRMKVNISFKQLKLAYARHKDNPLQMANVINTFAPMEEPYNVR